MNEGKPALFFYSFLFLIQVLIVAHVIKVPIFQKETVFNEMSLLCVCEGDHTPSKCLDFHRFS